MVRPLRSSPFLATATTGEVDGSKSQTEGYPGGRKVTKGYAKEVTMVWGERGTQSEGVPTYKLF